MSDSKEIGLPVHEKYAPPAAIQAGALIGSRAEYDRMYTESVTNREAYWKEQAEKNLDWMEPFHTVVEDDFNEGKIAWFLGGKLNVTANCLDRHLATRG